ncbi:hypothetical protein KKH43_03995 [Patescibacteria group bacterium]|nr:hypothetical protein [Patescibacteria group bacterium]
MPKHYTDSFQNWNKIMKRNRILWKIWLWIARTIGFFKPWWIKPYFSKEERKALSIIFFQHCVIKYAGNDSDGYVILRLSSNQGGVVQSPLSAIHLLQFGGGDLLSPINVFFEALPPKDTDYMLSLDPQNEVLLKLHIIKKPPRDLLMLIGSEKYVPEKIVFDIKNGTRVELDDLVNEALE